MLVTPATTVTRAPRSRAASASEAHLAARTIRQHAHRIDALPCASADQYAHAEAPSAIRRLLDHG
jgi:hypothetical protein